MLSNFVGKLGKFNYPSVKGGGKVDHVGESTA